MLIFVRAHQKRNHRVMSSTSKKVGEQLLVMLHDMHDTSVNVNEMNASDKNSSERTKLPTKTISPPPQPKDHEEAPSHDLSCPSPDADQLSVGTTVQKEDALDEVPATVPEVL